MNIAIGINLGLYAILVGDTRVIDEENGTQINRDDQDKVHKTKMGLITGAGFVQLLDNVTKRIEVEPITNTEILLSVIKEEYAAIRKKWGIYSQLESWISQTAWIFSYTTFKNGQYNLRVGMFHPSINQENHVIYEVGYPAIILPKELDTKTGNAICEPIMGKIIVPEDPGEIQSSIDHNVAVIVDVINALRPFCSFISRRFQVGIHRGDKVGVSEIIDIQELGISGFDIKMNET
jgi:hypothetical protein